LTDYYAIFFIFWQNGISTFLLSHNAFSVDNVHIVVYSDTN